MQVLAIDQGTTSTRAVVVDADGTATVVRSIEHRQILPRPGWVEHDPRELLASVEACVAAGDPSIRISGIDNQGESCLGWHRDTLEPVGPVIVWQDERTGDITAGLRAEGAEALTLERAGLPLDPYFSASKLGWILRNIPEAQRLAAAGKLCLGTTDSYFRHCLTGRFETDMATASRTSLMSLARSGWDEDLCALFGVPGESLPAITPTSGELGEIRGSSRILTASIVDQQAALRGHGCSAPGDAKITFGTGAFVLALGAGQIPPPGSGPLATVAWSDAAQRPVYALEGGVYTAGAALNWARGLGLFSDWQDIAEFPGPTAISRGVVFVPALAGLACPHWDRGAKGAWMGLGLDTGPKDLVQAVLEGIAYRTAEVIASMEAILPLARSVSVDGGVTRNRWFCQFLADCLGREVRVSQEAELTALGTALLAAEGAGMPIEPVRRHDAIAPRGQPAEWAATFARARGMARQMGASGTAAV